VRRVSFEERWERVGRRGVVWVVRGRPRRDSSVERRVERVEMLMVSVGLYVNV